MVVMLAVHHFLCRRSDGRGHLRRDTTEFFVDFGGGALDQREGSDEAAGKAKAADGKIADGTLCLRAPEGLVRHLHLAH